MAPNVFWVPPREQAVRIDSWRLVYQLAGYAHYQIESAKVMEQLSVHNCEHLPATESQARPLTTIDLEQVGDVCRQLAADDHSPTSCVPSRSTARILGSSLCVLVAVRLERSVGVSGRLWRELLGHPSSGISGQVSVAPVPCASHLPPRISAIARFSTSMWWGRLSSSASVTPPRASQ